MFIPWASTRVVLGELLCIGRDSPDEIFVVFPINASLLSAELGLGGKPPRPVTTNRLAARVPPTGQLCEINLVQPGKNN